VNAVLFIKLVLDSGADWSSGPWYTLLLMAPTKLRPWLEAAVQQALCSPCQGVISSGTDEWLQILQCHCIEGGLVFLELSDSRHRLRAFISAANADRIYASMDWEWADLATTFVKSVSGETKTTPRPFRMEPEIVLWLSGLVVYGAGGSAEQGTPSPLSESSVSIFQKLHMMPPADRQRTCPELPEARLVDAGGSVTRWGARGAWCWSDFVVPSEQLAVLHALCPEAACGWRPSIHMPALPSIPRIPAQARRDVPPFRPSGDPSTAGSRLALTGGSRGGNAPSPGSSASQASSTVAAAQPAGSSSSSHASSRGSSGGKGARRSPAHSALVSASPQPPLLRSSAKSTSAPVQGALLPARASIATEDSGYVADTSEEQAASSSRHHDAAVPDVAQASQESIEQPKSGAKRRRA
jgi:hypothetical protein